jgi:molybdate transport system regulatory protein
MSTKARKSPARLSTARLAPRPQSPTNSPGIRFRIDFDDRCSVGIGKVSLLEAIARTGSLSQAARAIGMSYRRAWLLIDSMNGEFDTPVVSATVGGSGGGGAQLTSFGRDLVQAYRKLEGRLTSLTAEHMSEVAAHVAGLHRRPSAGGAPLRGRLSRPLKQTASG